MKLNSSKNFALGEAPCRGSWIGACRRGLAKESSLDWCNNVCERREIATSLLDMLSSEVQYASHVARYRCLVICVFDARTITRQEARVVLPRKRDEEIQVHPPRRFPACARFAFIVCFDRAAQFRAHTESTISEEHLFVESERSREFPAAVPIWLCRNVVRLQRGPGMLSDDTHASTSFA
jgi:hypothetical protein